MEDSLFDGGLLQNMFQNEKPYRSSNLKLYFFVISPVYSWGILKKSPLLQRQNQEQKPNAISKRQPSRTVGSAFLLKTDPDGCICRLKPIGQKRDPFCPIRDETDFNGLKWSPFRKIDWILIYINIRIY